MLIAAHMQLQWLVTASSVLVSASQQDASREGDRASIAEIRNGYETLPCSRSKSLQAH